METYKNTNNDVPLAKLLLRLPIRSIAKFKSVCKRWKLLIESDIFRSSYVSLHKTSSCSWSLLDNGYRFHKLERIASYGCKRWGLTRPLSSYILSPPILDMEYDIKSFHIRAYASGLLLIRILDYIHYVGNPVLRKWVKIRPCTLSIENYYYSNMCGLATRVENDVVMGYKVILGCTKFQEEKKLIFQVYSSETGKWTCEHIRCPCPIPVTWKDCGDLYPITLNGMVHWARDSVGGSAGGMVVLDLYNEGDNLCHVIPFPENKITYYERRYPKLWSRSACSTSGGCIIYIDATSIYEDHGLKVWKLKDLSRWELLWEINLSYIEYGITCNPLAMHPFETDILYLMSLEKECMMSINLRTQKSRLYKDSEYHSDDDGNINFFKCPKMTYTHLNLFSQFVPSSWMDDVPRAPPCAHCGRP